MKQTYEDLTQNLKHENEYTKMDIEGNVMRVELKPPLMIQIHMPNGRHENANNDEPLVDIKTENQSGQNPNALLIEETIDINIKVENEEITFSAKRESSTKKANVKKPSVKFARIFYNKILLEIACPDSP